jgi:subtilisin family serine protease
MSTIQLELNALGVAQVLVYLKAGVAKELAASRSMAPAAEVTRHFKRNPTARAAAIASAEGMTRSPQPYTVYPHLGIVLGTVDAESYRAVKRSEAVRAVTAVPEISLIRPTRSALSDPVAGPTWGIQRLRIPELWEAGLTGKDVVVGHLDTGIDGAHPVFEGAIRAFAEFDDLGRQVAGAEPTDSGTHGTHTAGTIAGRPNARATVGVAPGALLASAMVIEGGNVIARILGGMDWSIGQGAKILSMSLGLRGYREEFLTLMRTIRARGILPVIAVGNEGAGTSRSPGNYDLCLSVGASDSQDEIPRFSSSQRFDRDDDPLVPDLVAPGVEVSSAMPGGGYGVKDGSSMAAPHIAGLAALLWEASPSATVDQIEAAILASCRRPATMSEARSNRGLPDAVVARDTLTGAAIAAESPAIARVARPATKRGATKRATTATKTATKRGSRPKTRRHRSK